MAKLTHLHVKRAAHSGRSRSPEVIADGNGLYLQLSPTGGRSWLFRFVWHGKQHWMGLGPLREVGLAEARRRAAEARALLRHGRNPLEERRRARREAALRAASGRTFAAAAERYLEAHAHSWRNPKHRQQWRNTLAAAVEAFGEVPVDEVTTEHVLAVLRPIWTAKPETASRLRGRIERVLDWATAAGWRSGDNPARWRGHLSHHLPPPQRLRAVRHHPALPWPRMPDFWRALATRRGTAAEALRFAILTAARSGEVRGARWREIDWQMRIWTIPPERTKARRAHRVPLGEAALEVLRRMRALADDDQNGLVFPSGRRGVPLSDMALAAVLRDVPGSWRDPLDQPVTVHGFRSTFRDWCGETQAAPRDVAEAALAHMVGDATERAYARGDLLEPRRELMERWARHVIGPAPEAVPIAAAREAAA